MEELLEELELSLAKQEVCLQYLVRTCINLGADRAITKFLLSPEFEDEACEYCRDMGWEEPR